MFSRTIYSKNQGLLTLNSRSFISSATNRLVNTYIHSLGASTFKAATKSKSLKYSTASKYGSKTATMTISPQAEIQEYNKYLLNTYNRPPMFLEKGEGCYLFDSEGNKYLDFTAGIAVVALGHSNPQVAQILAEQAQKIIHVSNLFYTKESCELAKSLVEATLDHYPQGKMGVYEPSYNETIPTPKVFITNSGTEANEGAIKFARKYGKELAKAGKVRVSNQNILKTEPNLKYQLHSFVGGFHGRSMGALSLTPNPKYQDPYTPLIPGATFSSFNETRELSTFINELTCGVIVEPIQGEGGINLASVEFLKAVRKRCDEVGAVLIYDEIQCGLARTGHFWAHHAYPPECSPDIITCAKPLANGFPIGGIIVSDKIAQAIKAGDHGTTFGGNPLGSAIGNYVVSQLSQPEFMSNVTNNGEYLGQKLKEIAAPYLGKQVLDVRGTGLIRGIQFKDSPAPLIKRAQELGLLLVEAGKNTIRFVPPLIVTKQQIDDATEILSETFKESFNQ